MARLVDGSDVYTVSVDINVAKRLVRRQTRARAVTTTTASNRDTVGATDGEPSASERRSSRYGVCVTALTSH